MFTAHGRTWRQLVGLVATMMFLQAIALANLPVAAAATALEQRAAVWAQSQTGSTSYQYQCLKFVYDAYINAGFNRTSLDAAAGYVAGANTYPIDEWTYWTSGHTPSGTLHVGADAAPPVGAIIYYSNRLGHDYSHATISLGAGNQISPDTSAVSASQPVTTNSYRTMLGWWLPDATSQPSGVTPTGYLDLVQSPTPGTIRVAGWASDGDVPAQALDIHIYIGGHAGDSAARGVDIGLAATYRADVGSHGFDTVLDSAPGTTLVCAYAINIGPPGGNPELGCRSVTVQDPNPTGQLMSPTNGAPATYSSNVLVYGRADDPNDPTARVDVRVFVGGRPGSVGVHTYDLGVVSDSGHIFNSVVPAPVGATTTICVFAINVGPGADTELGCPTVTVLAPTAPLAPTNVVAVPADRSATITWSSIDVGTPVTSTTVTAAPGGRSWTVGGISGNSMRVTGLTNGVTYSFTVTESNLVGRGTTSAPSPGVTPSPPPCPIPSGLTLSLGPAGSVLTTGTSPLAPVVASWTSDPTCTYQVQQQVSGRWTTTSTAKGSRVTLGAAPGAQIPSLRVRAFHQGGIKSAWATFTPRSVDAQQDETLSYPHGAGFRFSGSAYWGGGMTLLGATGVSAVTTVLADHVAVVGSCGPYYGAFQILIDGAPLTTVDTYCAANQDRRVLAAFAVSASPHTIEIVTVGTAGRPAVALDGILTLWP